MISPGGQPPSPADLIALVVRARSLDECLAIGRQDAAVAGSPGEAAERMLVRWSRAFARGDRDALRRRLRWDGLDEATAGAALTAGVAAPPGEPTQWSREVAAMIARCRETAAELRAGRRPAEVERLAGDEPPLFAELWAPFVRHARRRLQDRVADLSDLLADTALADLESNLLRHIAAVAELAVYHRFDHQRAAARVARPADVAADEPSRRLYEAFVLAMLDKDLSPFLLAHAALARQLALLVSTWVDATAELAGRLRADRRTLEERLNRGRPLGVVAAVSGGLSDRHNGGRQVLALRFSSGPRIVYKPRDSDLEAAYNAFLGWLRRQGLGPAPPALEAVSRPGYGWAEHVERGQAADDQGARVYFERAGALLCIAYLLNGADLHMDNVIATPEGPVLVDAEALVQPEVAVDDHPSGHRASCLDSGLLTFVQTDPDDQLVDIGGLCGRGGHLAARELRRWKQRNTDAMHPVSEALHAEPMDNILEVDGTPRGPEDEVEALVSGFAAAYRFFLAHRAETGAPDGPLAPLAAARTRVIFRPSNLYAVLLHRLAAPEYQREGLSRSLLVDSLNQVFSEASRRPVLWPLVAEERAALEALDIPHFRVPTSRSTLVSAGGATVDGYYSRSGIEVVTDRLAGLDEEDLERQCRLIEASLLQPQSLSRSPAAAVERAGVLPAGPLVRLAVEIGEQYVHGAVELGGGLVTWRLPPYARSPGADHLPFDLAVGTSGVALFLAALGRTSDDPRFCSLALSASRQAARSAIIAGGGAARDDDGIGACSGLGGLVYALTTVAGIADDADALEAAEAAARLITDDRIARDLTLDVEGGAAGAILGLLALHAEIRQPWVLERAASCGRHLLAAMEPAGDEGAGWRNRDGLMLAGFAHGAAGIACALARLYAVTRHLPFLEAARRGFASERRIYSKPYRNWPLLQRDEVGAVQQIPMTAWCHGAPGIALARIAAVAATKALGSQRLYAEIDTALETTVSAGLGGLDHLCCGNLGYIDVVMTAARILRRGHLVATTAHQAAMIIRRATSGGVFRLRFSEQENRCFQPGLLHGSAGVGYQLLRLADPDSLPSILALEAFCDGGRR